MLDNDRKLFSLIKRRLNPLAIETSASTGSTVKRQDLIYSLYSTRGIRTGNAGFFPSLQRNMTVLYKEEDSMDYFVSRLISLTPKRGENALVHFFDIGDHYDNYSEVIDQRFIYHSKEKSGDLNSLLDSLLEISVGILEQLKEAGLNSAVDKPVELVGISLEKNQALSLMRDGSLYSAVEKLFKLGKITCIYPILFIRTDNCSPFREWVTQEYCDSVYFLDSPLYREAIDWKILKRPIFSTSREIRGVLAQKGEAELIGLHSHYYEPNDYRASYEEMHQKRKAVVTDFLSSIEDDTTAVEEEKHARKSSLHPQ